MPPIEAPSGMLTSSPISSLALAVISALIFSDISATALSVEIPTANAASSSPPSLPHLLPEGTALLIISAHEMSTLSPMSCPYMSLTSLNESRSIIIRQPFFSEHILESSTAEALLLRNPVSLSSVASSLRSCISWELDMMLLILLRRTSGLNGFLIKSETPTSKPLVSVSTSSSAVRKITGVFITPFCCSICLNLARVSNPSITGIFMSSRTRSGMPFSLT